MTTFSTYAHVNEIVNKLTVNKTLQTFFTLFLMAEDDVKRSAILNDFQNAWNDLSGEEYEDMKKAFTVSFKNILPLAKDLRRRVDAFKNETHFQKQAA